MSATEATPTAPAFARSNGVESICASSTLDTKLAIVKGTQPGNATTELVVA
jgi:hypothetical protein